MNIIQDYIPLKRGNRPSIPMQAKYITIHDTANASKGANALMHAKYLKGDAAAARPASWHFTVDDQHIVQHLPLNEVGWHAGDGHGPGNMSSIGIEICENEDGNRAKAEANVAELVAYVLKQYPSLEVVQHNRWSGKNCPHVIRARKSGWEGFMKEVDLCMGQKFNDVKKGAWYESAIHAVTDAGYMSGYPDGTFKPNEPVTRAELAVVIAKVLKL